MIRGLEDCIIRDKFCPNNPSFSLHLNCIYNILIQCENVNDLYITDFFSKRNVGVSSKICKSAGLKLIDNLDFSKFPGTLLIKKYILRLEYFHEARKTMKINTTYLNFWVDKDISELRNDFRKIKYFQFF